MFHLRELKNRFKLKVSEYNKSVAWLNNVAEGWGMKIARPDNPSTGLPVVFAVDFDKLSSIFVTKTRPSDTSNFTGLTSGFHAGAIRTPKAASTSFAGTGNGVKIKVCTRIGDDGQDYTFCFREFTISNDGRVLSIGGESFS